LWHHSVEAAHIAEALALRTGKIDPSDAYTVGLLHDIGLLVLQLVNRQARERRERLKNAGCSTAVAELVTSGVSHAEAGAQVFRAWNLPEEYATAIEYHHEPEHCESVFAALLYVVECVTGSEEDLPSSVRWSSAMTRLGLNPTDLQDALSSSRHATRIISMQ
jgi:putative nucleotidyltransferase with HDIG domain